MTMMLRAGLALGLFGIAAVAPSAAAAPQAAKASIGTSVDDFYRSRASQPLWFANNDPAAARALVQLLATSRIEGLNPKRYDASRLSRLVEDAARNPAARHMAELQLSRAFTDYVRDARHDPKVGIVYVDAELIPHAPAPAQILADAASAPSLSQYVNNMGWMNPVYGKLRQALTARLYRDRREEALLRLNLERARALPPAKGRYIIVNTAVPRLYMYDGDTVVDSMRVVAGKPESQTPMMNAYIKYVALNPYWNVPPETASHNLAPKVLKEGRSYFTNRGYTVFSGWGDDAKPIDPMTVDWKAVADGRLQVRMRQNPGPANSMGKMKFMFPNKEGIWLHDTPVLEKIDDPARMQSGGCVRLEDAARLQRWIYGKALAPKGSRPEQEVPVPGKMPLYLTYLTAVPSGTQIVYFDDVYGRDQAPRKR